MGERADVTLLSRRLDNYIIEAPGLAYSQVHQAAARCPARQRAWARDRKTRRRNPKAILLTGHGGPEMLRYGDAPDPIPALDEIVVDVHAASVNAADYRPR